MPNEHWVDVPARLEAIIGNIRRYRASLYPEDWTYDPLYLIERELEALLQEMREKRPA